MVIIRRVAQDSPAARAGILPCDELHTINGTPVTDVLDYRFLVTEERVTLSLLRRGQGITCVIDKEQYEDLGLEFDTFLMDRERSCENNCIFCFIDQNPRGMRETVYFKDDDTRLSFLHGNYVTLTNVTDAELARMARLRLSPINVSVHTTDPALRVQMLANPEAGRIMEQLRFFAERDIRLNCQLVLCRGINDGDALVRTLTDLLTLTPALQSVAVVPVGLTRFREGLPALEEYDCDSAREVIATVERFVSQNCRGCESRLVYCADELYVRAELPLPAAEYYDGYPQLDNGVGLLRSLEEDVRAELSVHGAVGDSPRRYLCLTGEAACGFLTSLVAEILAENSAVTCQVRAVKNRFFGPSVTVAGLLTGSDYLAALDSAQAQEYDAILIPASSLRHERDLFLDGLCPADLSRAWGRPVLCTEGGEDLVHVLLGGN